MSARRPGCRAGRVVEHGFGGPRQAQALLLRIAGSFRADEHSRDAQSYDVSSQPQQAWAADVLERLRGIAPDATVVDVGCGTGRATEQLLELVPRGRVLAFDASPDMVELARARLGDPAELWCQDVLSLELPEPVDVVASNAVLHWSPSTPACGGRWGRRCGREGG